MPPTRPNPEWRDETPEPWTSIRVLGLLDSVGPSPEKALNTRQIARAEMALLAGEASIPGLIPWSEESACNAGDRGLITGLGRFSGEGNGNPPQYSCLENSMDREAWWATVHGITKSWAQLSS